MNDTRYSFLTLVAAALLLLPQVAVAQHSFTQGPPISAEAEETTPPTQFGGGITLTQSELLEVTGGGVRCGNADLGYSTENYFYRVFDLSIEPEIEEGFSVSQVTAGIAIPTWPDGTPTQTGTIYLYNLTTPPAGGIIDSTALVQVGQADFDLDGPAGALLLQTVEISGSFADDDLLVATMFLPTGDPEVNTELPGSVSMSQGGNEFGTTANEFLASASCGISNPQDITTLGAFDSQWSLAVTGTVFDPGSVCTGDEIIQQAATNGLLQTTSDGPIGGQSFTAPCSGLITTLGIVPGSIDGVAQGDLVIYEGAGAGGAELAVQPFSFENLPPTNDDLFRTSLGSDVAVTAGQEYTFFVLPSADNANALILNASNTNPYDGGTVYTSEDGNPANAEQTPGFDLGFEVQFAPVSTAGEEGATPTSAIVSAVYPNPFSALGSFMLAIEQSQNVRVAVYDVLGREVALLHDGPLAAEEHTFQMNVSTWFSGIYFVSVQGEAFLETQKFVVVQ